MNTENQTTPDLTSELHPRRDFKSRMFILIFHDKKRLLRLYNAISGRNYTNPEQLTITTLENAIYMSMKNDLSFLIGMRLSLYEHKDLADYAEYTYRVRKYAKEMSIEDAVEKTINECIREDILKDFLLANKAEAKKVSIYEYNEEEHMRMEREDAFEDGVAEGLAIGREEGLAAGREEGLAAGREEGLAAGREEGLAAGRGQIVELISKMTADGLGNQASRLGNDSAFYQEMMKKYFG